MKEKTAEKQRETGYSERKQQTRHSPRVLAAVGF